MNLRKGGRLKFGSRPIDPDEIMIDAENLPRFDTSQFEGRLARPISKRVFLAVGGIGALLFFIFSWQVYALQVKEGEGYKEISETHSLSREVVFAERGLITDRNGARLAWNEPGKEPYPDRLYIKVSGLAHLLGHISYPKRDKRGNYYETSFSGRDGAERSFDGILAGKNGLKLEETDAKGKQVSESEIVPPENGREVRLSVDSRVQAKLYELIRARALAAPFTGGAGVIMDVRTGEILALTSYPEYDPEVISFGKDTTAIRKYFSDPGTPLLNRAIAGLYTPGSIVKPYVAIGALEEGVISPEKQILSTGSISIPNPYDPKKPSIFKDWREQGWMNMRLALAYSSNVYFFEIGGGFETQPGLGIERLNSYANMFGFGKVTGIDLTPESEEEGLVPNPRWKAEVSPEDPWRIGDTYNTSIGQYGFLVTPVQAARAVSAIANGGKLLLPTIKKWEQILPPEGERLPVLEDNLKIIREGMRAVVTEPRGTGGGLNISGVKVAAKSGTAEIGISKAKVNSWITGFFPYDNPRYAFAVVMERGSRENIVGATFVTKGLLEWMVLNTPEYLK
ncbi:MAG: penicillin-binding transpeptidase domain-containing protein [Patescibacteria group bacterium]